MTEATRSIDQVPGLVEERRKYEAWLSALEARRATTAQHVFDRVKADYETRLHRVQEELASHRHAIQEERASLVSRRSLLEADEQLRSDERAELELRLHVGEIAGEPADEAFFAVDEALERLTGEKDDLSKRIADLDGLLEEKPEVVVTTEAIVEQPAGEAEAAPAEMAAADVQPTAEAAETRADESAIVTAEHAVERATTEAAIRTPANAEKSQADRDPRRTPGGTFDELAFLSDIVGDNKGDGKSSKPTNSEDSGSESLLAGLSEPGRRRSGEAPLGSNVPGHTPIVLKTATATEQVKTLKCTECGAMNYATEWYCERCGAELAAL
ncbi:MAG TPA: hypothetical protein VGM50_18850 [Gemmatimonadaceae bacterium]